MIEIGYTLHTGDGDLVHEVRQAPLVPRVGELVTLGSPTLWLALVARAVWFGYRAVRRSFGFYR
ncbi:hypothetical protein [Amycolatopsis anabasis]|uniref:hypothetical protein n=1 Tax=Amycolatopsis anabasis TaxID=1840409 RepID=UPI00131E8E43|nr:hypothetical protein [Amycolatopsis anabasis]